MTVLAFDTATSSCAITLWRDGVVLAEAQEVLARGHAEVLVPMIESVLADAGMDYHDLDVLAVTVGPGAFTGIRIGLATARALALASALPLIGMSNFEALVYATTPAERQSRKVVVALETKRADFYLQIFDEFLQPQMAPQAVAEEDLKQLVGQQPILLCGDVGERVSNILGKVDVIMAESGPYVLTKIVAARADEIYNSAKPLFKFPAPEPLYLKPPDVNLAGIKPRSRILSL